jgi:hypothetical protein
LFGNIDIPTFPIEIDFDLDFQIEFLVLDTKKDKVKMPMENCMYGWRKQSPNWLLAICLQSFLENLRKETSIKKIPINTPKVYDNNYIHFTTPVENNIKGYVETVRK